MDKSKAAINSYNHFDHEPIFLPRPSHSTAGAVRTLAMGGHGLDMGMGGGGKSRAML